MNDEEQTYISTFGMEYRSQMSHRLNPPFVNSEKEEEQIGSKSSPIRRYHNYSTTERATVIVSRRRYS